MADSPAFAALDGEDKSAFLRAEIGGEEVVFVLIADGHDGKDASQVTSHWPEAHCQIAAAAPQLTSYAPLSCPIGHSYARTKR